MGNEAIGSIGSALGSVATAVGRGAASVEQASTAVSSVGAVSGIGKMSAFVASLEAPLSGFIKKGPAASLEGFVTMGKSDLKTLDLMGGTNRPGFNPAGEILFQAEPRVNEPVVEMNEANVLAGVEHILTEASVRVAGFNQPAVSKQPVWEVFLPQVEPVDASVNDNNLYDRTPYWYEPYGHTLMRSSTSTLLNSVFSPALEPQAKTQTENRVSARPAVAPATAILPQPAPTEQEVEEIVEEKKEKQELKERLEEDIEIEKQMYLEDENASAQRRIEVREAVVKARVEADRLGLKKIAGWLIAKFLPGEHEGNRSQVVRKTGPDGSYQETIEAITGAGEFESGEKAIERFDGIVAEKKPVKFGKNGNPVGNIDIARVFKYRLIKPMQVYEEVVKRVVKKKVLVSQAQSPVSAVVTEKREINVEPNLEELNPALAEVFQKAA